MVVGVVQGRPFLDKAVQRWGVDTVRLQVIVVFGVGFGKEALRACDQMRAPSCSPRSGASPYRKFPNSATIFASRLAFPWKNDVSKVVFLRFE